MGLKFDDDVRIVVEEGSISDAAKRLNISQPALSARIRKLEEQYGIRIFKRNRRPVTLTDEGKLYLDYMTRVQNMDKEFRRTVAQTEELLDVDNPLASGASSSSSASGISSASSASSSSSSSNDQGGFPVAGVVGIIAALIAAILAAFFFLKRGKKAADTLSDATGNTDTTGVDDLKDDE